MIKLALARGWDPSGFRQRFNNTVIVRDSPEAGRTSSHERAEKARRLIDHMANEGVQFLQLQFMDVLGRLKTISLPVEQAPRALESGWQFDGSSVAGYATIEESDLIAMPDLSTFLVEPWTDGDLRTARFICDIHTPSGDPFAGDPRRVLKRALEKASQKGYIFNTGPEFEFYLFRRDAEGNPTTTLDDHGSYFDLMPLEHSDLIRKRVVDFCRAAGYPVDSFHHEVGQSQHELDLEYTDALTIADRIATLKHGIKTVAAQNGLFASFMPKPIFNMAGNGMHVHVSLADKETGTNLFYDASGPKQLSRLTMHFLGGLLTHARATCAVLNSSVNSFKRIVPGFEAPCYIAWAHHNRSALVRVPAGRGKSTRLELRNPDPAGNPYLQFAAILAAGLDGIERELEPPAPVERDIFKMSEDERRKQGIESLPSNLGHALSFMKDSPLMREVLGEHILNHLLHAQMQMYRDYETRVTMWEYEHLLPVL